tara:strand:+ start:108 stop:368 length:261 start_codon:yes stop_codon:yes gene_type:complete
MSGLFNNQNQLQIFINETINDNLSKKFKVIITNFNISNTYYLAQEQIDKLKLSGMFNVEEITHKQMLPDSNDSSNKVSENNTKCID